MSALLAAAVVLVVMVGFLVGPFDGVVVAVEEAREFMVVDLSEVQQNQQDLYKTFLKVILI